ncbi:MAG: ABC transporter permease [Bacteroidia bacterium]|nr:MAG: ABC transporter permease [Bacteroidia bacterium]
MFTFLVKRLWYGIWVLFGVLTLVFLLFTVLPGDPARMMLGQRADISSVEAIRRDLGLDRPVHQQYLHYLNDISPLSLHKHAAEESLIYLDPRAYAYMPLLRTGEYSIVLKKPYLRRSYQSDRSVNDILWSAFPNTLLLASTSILFAMLLGVFLGTFIALKRKPWLSRGTLIFSVLGMSLPSFFAAIIIAWVFAYLLGDYTGLNMSGSILEVDDFGRGEYIAWKNLILPALTLGIRPLAIVTELTRSSLNNIMTQDYIRTARAKGLPEYLVITRHALKNALNPVITAVSGWFASLLAGAVFVEYVFDWKGIGVVIVDALEYYDFPVLMGALLVISVMLVFVNIAVDIIYAILDPRVRLS